MGYNAWAEGSCLIQMGNTHVLVTATIEDKVPPFMRGQGQGWITAEYGMLPRATQERTLREAARGRQQGRTVEIQRLIGRSLRAAVNPKALGERSVLIDCDVLQADGGTRTASITAGFLAMLQALTHLKQRVKFSVPPITDRLAAISLGVQDEDILLDLNYIEDSRIGVDVNVVMLGHHQLVEIQGTAEHGTFDRQKLNHLLDVAETGIDRLIAAGREAFPAGDDLIAAP
jgi:ribonuclease PH